MVASHGWQPHSVASLSLGFIGSERQSVFSGRCTPGLSCEEPSEPDPLSLGSPGQVQARESNTVGPYCPYKQFAIHGLEADYLKRSKLEGADPATSICPPPTLPVCTENEKCEFSSVLPPTSTQDASTVTDVCRSEQQAEVEIISLEENIPLYHLRANTVQGYDNDDWLHTPLVSSDVDLSFDVIDETLKYMLLCAERVGQITKTYSDIDAVTRLLEEKERDLELTARIGQSLLKKVKVLTERNEYLEEKIEHVTEEVSQLRHDLSLKDELLHIYTINSAESDAEQQDDLPPLSDGSGCSFFIGPKAEHTDSVQKKLHFLESENLSLRTEASHLKNETVNYEEKEKQLVNDCVKELRQTSTQLTTLTEDLMRRSDDAARQQEEITQLLAQVVDLQRKVKTFAADNDELNQHLAAAKEAQKELTGELRYIKEKMQQCTDMLHEAQEEAKNLRNKAGMQATSPRWFHPLVNFPMDSLAAEIEGTMRRQLEDSANPDKSRERRMFDTVRNVNEASKRRLRSLSPLPIPGSNRTSTFGSNQSSSFPSPRSSYYGSETSATNRSLDVDMGSEGEERRPGQPGMPGSNDLETALRRLAVRREALLSERRFMDEEWDRRLLELSRTTTVSTSVLSRPSTPTGSDSSDSRSAMSCGVRSFLPDKLQIVKPLEGSTTLQHWQNLAQPNLEGILDMRPGVLTKGDSIYDASDSRGPANPEEDEPCKDVDHQQDEMAVDAVPELDKFNSIPAQSAAQDTAPYPGKCSDDARYTYTLTTCRIIHPTDDTTSVSRSECAEDTGPHFDLRLED